MPQPNATNSATIGFEAKLWFAADKLRNNMGAAEYKSGGGQTLSSSTNPVILIQS